MSFKLVPLKTDIDDLIVCARWVVKTYADIEHGGGLWGERLRGYCGIASRFLQELAERYNVPGVHFAAGLFGGKIHCWVEYKDYCIDLTVSQFNKSKKNAMYKFDVSDCEYIIVPINGNDSEFYQNLYYLQHVGLHALSYQDTFTGGQSYEKHRNALWELYAWLYPRGVREEASNARHDSKGNKRNSKRCKAQLRAI